MQTIDSIKRQIDNVEDLLTIVETMKMMAAVNIRQYEQSVGAIDEYNRTVEMGFQVLMRAQGDGLSTEPVDPDAPVGVVIFGSDQGMCGQFNEQIAAFARAELVAMGVRRANWRVLLLGARLAAHFEAQNEPFEAAWGIPGSVKGITPLGQDILMQVDTWRNNAGVNRVLLFYNQPLSGATYRPNRQQLLPVEWAKFRELGQKAWPTNNLPTFTMDWQQLLAMLLRQYLFVSVYRAFAQSLMSENASRLATMQSAERNIKDHLEELNTLFHQQRQTAITAELLEIISGFETLTATA